MQNTIRILMICNIYNLNLFSLAFLAFLTVDRIFDLLVITPLAERSLGRLFVQNVPANSAVRKFTKVFLAVSRLGVARLDSQGYTARSEIDPSVDKSTENRREDMGRLGINSSTPLWIRRRRCTGR
jgi:hypothetical protein